MTDEAPRELSNRELIAWLQQFDPDAVVSLDIRMLETVVRGDPPMIADICHFTVTDGIAHDGGGLVAWVKLTGFVEPY